MKPFDRKLPDENPEYTQFLQTERWANIRGAVIRRDGGRCCFCGCKNGLQVHHIRYKDEYGDPDLCNPEFLVTLCAPCHQIITDAVAKARDIQLEIPAHKIKMYQMADENFARHIRYAAENALYGKQQEIVSEAMVELWKRSLRSDSQPINIGYSKTYRAISAIILETLQHQAGRYASWINVCSKMVTDKKIAQLRAQYYNHFREQGHSDRDVQVFLGLNDAQMFKIRNNAKRLLDGDGGSG